MNPIRLAAIAAAIATIVPALGARAAVIFSDEMSSPFNWSVLQSFDSLALFGYDYSFDGLPPAPRGGGDTVGLKFEVNNFPPPGLDQVLAVHHNPALTGQYTLRADVWINWALFNGSTGPGTTEYAGVGVGHNGFSLGPSGASYVFDGDGDVTPDYVFYKNGLAQGAETGQYALGNTFLALDNSNPILTQAFPPINVAVAVPTQGQTGITFPGAGGFQWMTINVEVDTNAIGPSGLTANPGYARFTMRSDSSGNIVEIGTIDNSNGGPVVNMSGSIALMMLDTFTSVSAIPAFSFAIFDNIQVFEGLVRIPEPTTALLWLPAALWLPLGRVGRRTP